MTKCSNCSRLVEAAKSRTVHINGRQAALCSDCGRIGFTAASGGKFEGNLQAVNPPARRAFGGRSVTVHADKPPAKNELLSSPVVSGMRLEALGLPARLRVAHVRPLQVIEKVVQSAQPAEGAGKRRQRNRVRTIGYSVRLFPA